MDTKNPDDVTPLILKWSMDVSRSVNGRWNARTWLNGHCYSTMADSLTDAVKQVAQSAAAAAAEQHGPVAALKAGIESLREIASRTMTRDEVTAAIAKATAPRPLNLIVDGVKMPAWSKVDAAPAKADPPTTLAETVAPAKPKRTNAIITRQADAVVAAIAADNTSKEALSEALLGAFNKGVELSVIIAKFLRAQVKIVRAEGGDPVVMQTKVDALEAAIDRVL